MRYWFTRLMLALGFGKGGAGKLVIVSGPATTIKVTYHPRDGGQDITYEGRGEQTSGPGGGEYRPLKRP